MLVTGIRSRWAGTGCVLGDAIGPARSGVDSGWDLATTRPSGATSVMLPTSLPAGISNGSALNAAAMSPGKMPHVDADSLRSPIVGIVFVFVPACAPSGSGVAEPSEATGGRMSSARGRDLGIGTLDLRRSVTYSLSAHLSSNERGAVDFFSRARIGRRAERVLATLSRGERRHASRTSSLHPWPSSRLHYALARRGGWLLSHGLRCRSRSS